MLSSSDRVYVAGHRGLVGSALWRLLDARGFRHLIGRSSAELDLRDRDAVWRFFAGERPDVVVIAAAKVGGIAVNASQPAEFLSDNLRIQTNLLDAAAEHGVRRLLFLGSSCIYPKFTPQPISEHAPLTGPLEPISHAYAIANIVGVLGVQAIRREYGLPYISAMPTNLYGPNDNFDPATSHVLPALIRRFHEAKQTGAPSVTVWAAGGRDGSSCTSTTWRGPVCSCWRATTRKPRSTSGQARTSRSGSSPSSWPASSAIAARSSSTPANPTARRASC
jgi:GDP-L-fucose synthase